MITTCTVCGASFDQPSEDDSDNLLRACRACWDTARRSAFRLTTDEKPCVGSVGHVLKFQRDAIAAGLMEPQPQPLPEPEAPQVQTVQTSAQQVSPRIGRNEAIARIRAGLRARSGKTWSVTGGSGTAWGWIHVRAQPKRCTYTYREDGVDARGDTIYNLVDTGAFTGRMGPEDCAELAKLLGLDKIVHAQGESIPASGDYYVEFVDRAEGRTPSRVGEPYWD